MKINSKLLAAGFLSVFSLLLSACATNSQRSNSHTTYNEICEDRQETAASGGSGARASSDPSWYVEGSKTQDIAKARGYLQRVRHDYEAFECNREIDNRNLYDRPLLVTAVVAAGAALAHANAYILGGIGLAAGGMATFKSYNHPDTDRDAFLTAYAQLTCAYDETHSLQYSISVDKLTYDRDALQIAISAVTQDIVPLLADPDKQSAQQKAFVAAANTAITAGNKAVDAINASLTDYSKISTVLYKTVDNIDITARGVNKTNGTYASFTSSIKDAYAAAGDSKAKTEDAKKEAGAADAAQKAAGMVAATATPDKKASKQKNVMDTLIVASTRVRPASATFRSSCNPGLKDCNQVVIGSDGTAVESSTGSELRASRILADPASGDLAKLVSLAQVATESLPTPTYADIIANVTACVPKS